MKKWEYQCLKGCLKSLRGTLQYTYGSDHDTIMKTLLELDGLIKSLDNFDVEEDD